MKSLSALVPVLGVLALLPRTAEAIEYEYDSEYGEYEVPDSAWIGRNTDAGVATATPLGKVSASATLPYTSRVTYEDGFGNSTWGARYRAEAYGQATTPYPDLGGVLSSEYRTSTGAGLTTWITAAGKDMRFLGTQIHFDTNTNPLQGNGVAELYAFGYKLNDWTIPVGSWSVEKTLWSWPFVDERRTAVPVMGFSVAGIGVSVSFALGASAYLKIGGKLNFDGAAATLTPGMEAHLTANASADAWVAEIWAKGTLSLIDVSVPITAQAVWKQSPANGKCTQRLNAQLTSDVRVRSLKGKLRVGLKTGWGLFTKGMTVASWSGQDRRFNIFQQGVTSREYPYRPCYPFIDSPVNR